MWQYLEYFGVSTFFCGYSCYDYVWIRVLIHLCIDSIRFKVFYLNVYV